VPCASCGRNKKGNGYIQPKVFDMPPFSSNDIMVYEPQTGETRRYVESDFPTDRHRLFLFFPETFTPVCATEMGNLNKWIDEFDKLGVDVFGATTDPIHAVKDWYQNEEALSGSKYKVLSTYMLASRLGITNGGRAKRASVFMMKEGDVVVQEHFMKVGRSLKELHRMAYGYVQDSYCAEGWEDPSEGFLDGVSSKE
jgi:alkyl hydroperoxide reductase subunit AhpC